MVLWSQLNDRHDEVSSNLLRDDDVRTVEDEGRQFVVVNVPRASRLIDVHNRQAMEQTA